MADHARRRTAVLAVVAPVLYLSAAGADGARFGVPPGVPPGPPTGDPAGYLMLVSSDTVNDTVSDAFGDVAHFTTLYIEVGDPSAGLVVDLYDPGLFDPAGGAAQLDVNLDPASGVGTMSYVLYGPDPTDGTPDSVLATMVFGSDDASSDRGLVRLHEDPAPRPGLYHLVCRIDETVGVTQDISVFGVSVPGHDVYTHNLTLGEANAGPAGMPEQGGATIAEPVSVFPWVMRPSPGTDALGPVCGLRFVSFDMEAALNGEEPPDTTVTTPSGFTFEVGEVSPSGDSRWFGTDLGGVDAGPLESDDHGAWRWDFSELSQPEDAFGNLVEPLDLNAFSLQLLDYAAADRDFTNWPDVPDRPPFILFNPDSPRRIYLPADDGSAPTRATLGHSAEVVAGFPVVSQDETSTLRITVEIANPHAFALTGLVGETTVAPNPDVTDPSVVGSSGVVAVATGRTIDFSGDVAAGTTASFSYEVDVTPSDLGRSFLTGDGVDFVSAGTAPTVATYQTPYTDPGGAEIPQEVLGPICQLEYESIVPPCAVDATIVASEPLTTCPGTEVVLDGSTSEVFNCDTIGGVPIFQWRVNDTIVEPFPGPESVTATPFMNDTWTLEVACSTDPADCLGTDEVTFDLYPEVTVDLGGDRTACAGDAVTLTATITTSNPPAGDFLWTTDPPGADGDGATTDSITVSPASTTTYTFTTTDAVGCTGQESVVVTVPMPSPEIVPAAPDLCPGETIDLSASAGFASYEWSSDPPGLPGDGSTGETVTVGDVDSTWTVTVTDADGCTGQASVTVVAAPEPVPEITPADPTLCLGGSVGLIGEPGFVEYLWDSGGADPAVDGATTPNVTASVIGATYTLTVTDARGCTGSSSVTTAERAPFEPAITPPNPELCPGGSVTLTAEAGFIDYLWTTDPPGLAGDGETTPSIVAMDAATYTLEVEDAAGCTGVASVTTVVSPDDVPGALGPTLRLEKAPPSDLRLTWLDLPDAVSDYEVVSLDCDADLDGTCETDPTAAALGSMPTTSTLVAPGVEELVETDGLNRPSWLVYYKVRGLSPCSATPGPFLSP